MEKAALAFGSELVHSLDGCYTVLLQGSAVPEAFAQDPQRT